ncbi:general odorant-binding protein 67-like [Culex pipiens pallens]|uniref:general odorant-binding protein 67-like n=1 Tax=Culex pipiens pallens TaxID=42434 RepID=UPI0022AB3277|nr:general odorant-binding protein 67-like [Culex pipiens pallens]
MFQNSVLLTFTIFLSFTRAEYSSYYATCPERYARTTIASCCTHPLLMPPVVMKSCLAVKLPPVVRGHVAPEKPHCQAECALNMTKILTNKKFSAVRAKQVLTSRIPPKSEWSKLVEKAVNTCYKAFYVNPFDFHEDIKNNKTSSQCLPSASLFLNCVIGITYRDCPNASWIGGERCSEFIRTLMDCPYIFVQSTVY